MTDEIRKQFQLSEILETNPDMDIQTFNAEVPEVDASLPSAVHDLMENTFISSGSFDSLTVEHKKHLANLLATIDHIREEPFLLQPSNDLVARLGDLRNKINAFKDSISYAPIKWIVPTHQF